MFLTPEVSESKIAYQFANIVVLFKADVDILVTNESAATHHTVVAPSSTDMLDAIACIAERAHLAPANSIVGARLSALI
jgi:hypothetical protein